jgi:putative FmdB family regulatory protein
MPLYEFGCEECEKDFELLVPGTNWRGTACPHCGSKKLTKKLSVFAAQNASASSPAPQACARPGGCGCVGGRHRH